MKKQNYRLSAVFWKEGRHILAKCPELNVCTFAPTLERAKARLQEAVELYLENARALGMLDDLRPMLSSSDRYTTTIEVPA